MYKTPRENKEELVRTISLLFGAFFVLLLVGSFVFHIFEDWSYLDSLHYATISLTSRGYSDRVAEHWFSILFSVLYLIVGVAILIASLSNLVAFYTTHYQEHVTRKVEEFKDSFFFKKNKKDKWYDIKFK